MSLTVLQNAKKPRHMQLLTPGCDKVDLAATGESPLSLAG
jgi:hypothetical protein